MIIRGILGVGFAGLVLAPVLLPIISSCVQGSSIPVQESARLANLLITTLALALGAILVSVPLGMLAGVCVVLIRPYGSSLVLVASLVGILIPLPMYAIAWQIILGQWLPPLARDPGSVVWRPWEVGLLPAIWVHGMAAIPWVIVMTVAGFRWMDPAMDDEARQVGGWRAVIRLVITPRAKLVAVAASLWVAVQAATEIPVTDAMMVRTLAEEVYTQFVSGSAGVPRISVITLLLWLAIGALGWPVARRMTSLFAYTPMETNLARVRPAPSLVMAVASFGFATGLTLCVGLPLAAMVAASGGYTSTEGWRGELLLAECQRVVQLHGLSMLGSLTWAGITGMVTSALALVICRYACRTRARSLALAACVVIIWVTPGPVVGWGLKLTIDYLLSIEEIVLQQAGLTLAFPPIRSLLYDQPSPVPGMWAALIRFFPIATMIVWPVVRTIPETMYEEVQSHTVSTWADWRLVTWPLAKHAFWLTTGAVTALALGEISASKLVTPPHYQSFILELFYHMHYGAEATVAALALVQIAMVVSVMGIVVMIRHLMQRRRSG